MPHRMREEPFKSLEPWSAASLARLCFAGDFVFPRRAVASALSHADRRPISQPDLSELFFRPARSRAKRVKERYRRPFPCSPRPRKRGSAPLAACGSRRLLQIDQIGQDIQRFSVNRIGIRGISVFFIKAVFAGRCRRSFCVLSCRW
jgi:hypothetical protein